jgi:hypothetical protein
MTSSGSSARPGRRFHGPLARRGSGARRGRLGERRILAAGAALLVATGLGVGLGALVAPSSIAGPAPAGVGFLPERGWSVLQNGGDGTAVRPAMAVAANVSLSPADDSEGLPYATLRTLPPHGVVLVVGFVRSESGRADRFPRRPLPLDVREASPFIEWGVQVRPERPLGQYQLLATVEGYAVDVSIYFGTARPSKPHLDAAQRQLDRLVVGPAFAPARVPRSAGPSPAGPSASSAPAPFDRTWSCAVPREYAGGPRVIQVHLRPRQEIQQTTWGASAGVTVSQGGFNSPSLVYFSPGPQDDRRPNGALLVSRTRCVESKRAVLLSATGLSKPPVRFEQSVECRVAPRVLIRFRTTLDRVPFWRREGENRVTSVKFGRAAFVVASDRLRPTPIAYGEIAANGETRFFGSSRCE